MSKKTIPPTPSRKDYTEDKLYEIQAEKNAEPIFHYENPYQLFEEWMVEARHLEMNDSNAMSLATVDNNGMPDVRIVLLKSFDERGFVFYSNGESAKGRHLAKHPLAALCLHWKSLRRQVRIRGAVEPVSENESDEYFASRARSSQIGAIASDQSRPLESRLFFENRLQEMEKQYEGQSIPRPAHWGGWRIQAQTIEFWRDRPFRLHDRLQYQRINGLWQKQRLYP